MSGGLAHTRLPWIPRRHWRIEGETLAEHEMRTWQPPFEPGEAGFIKANLPGIIGALVLAGVIYIAVDFMGGLEPW